MRRSFDGGPQYGADTAEILPIQVRQALTVNEFGDASFKEHALLATTGEEFKAGICSVDIRGTEVALNRNRANKWISKLAKKYFYLVYYNRGK